MEFSALNSTFYEIDVKVSGHYQKKSVSSNPDFKNIIFSYFLTFLHSLSHKF